jgi:hypothetical protein
MPVRKLFFLLIMTLWIAEPFLSLMAPKIQVHHTCPNCGMEDMCGDICCCVNAKTLCGHLPGLYAAGCTPDSTRNSFFAQSAVKFLPASHPALFRMDLKRTFAFLSVFLPSPPVDQFSPPPKSDYFA